jgi:hypothetical protein
MDVSHGVRIEGNMTRVSKEDRIDYLMRRKLRGKLVAVDPPSFARVPYKEQKAAREEIASYRAELESKPFEELDALYEQEKEKERQAAKLNAERERQRFFNHPQANPDFEYWSKAPYWTLDEAIALTFGKEPEFVTWEDVSAYLTVSPFAQEYARVRKLALRAKACGQLYDPVSPGFFLAWAKRHEIEVPTELTEQVEKRGIWIADWKDRYDRLKTQHDDALEQIKAMAGKINDLTNERDALHEMMERPSSSETTLSEFERDSLLKMVLGMAIEAYDYTVGSSRNAATGEKRGSISVDLQRCGLNLDADTVRKYLRQAEERFRDIVEKPQKT